MSVKIYRSRQMFSKAESLAGLTVNTVRYERVEGSNTFAEIEVTKAPHTGLLSHGKNTKMLRGTEEVGYRVYDLSLTPHTMNSSGANLCTHATAECRSGCIVNSGFAAVYPTVNSGRRHKTDYLLQHPKTFLRQLFYEIAWAIGTCKRKGIIPAFRLNAYSDIDWSLDDYRHPVTKQTVFEAFPNTQFYGYTKVPAKLIKSMSISNWHLTWSYTGKKLNHMQAANFLTMGATVSVVFANKDFPETFMGVTVIDGDEHDMRFLDDRGVVVGLKLKSSGKHLSASNSDFVVSTE